MPLAPLPEVRCPALQVLDDEHELNQYTQHRDEPSGERSAESSLVLSGMHCAACADILESALRAVPGVMQAHVSAASHRATVQWNPARVKASALFQAVRHAGYDAAPDTGAQARNLRTQERRTMLWRLFVAAFCSMQIMMLAWPSYTAKNGDLEPDLAQLLNWAAWVLSLPVLAFSALPFFKGAWHSLRAQRLAMDVPVALGIAVCFVASTVATFSPAGALGDTVYFDSLSMFVAFLLAARLVELHARHRASQVLEDALNTLPEVAHRRAATGEFEAVSLSRLRVGDVARVSLGEAFPADGRLLQGATEVDESLLTGESQAVARAEGDAVVAGSFNRGGAVLMQVEQVGQSTQRAAILNLMRQASTQRPASAALVDRMAGPFLWTVLALAALGGLAWSVIDPSRAVWIVVSVLVVTCPCALSLATPATLLAAAAGLARRGVLVRDLSALERLAQVDTVMLDKTGTLTDPLARLRSTTVLDTLPLEALGALTPLQAAAALASASTHPVAQSVRAAAGVSAAPEGLFQQLREHMGLGITGVDALGRTWRLGSSPWACAADGQAPAARVWLGMQGKAVAAFTFEEALRSDAAQALNALSQRGLRVHLVSGDAAARVADTAQGLPFDRTVADASPSTKLQAISTEQAAGHRVAMVGDGVNDAPVLARANVSFAMAQGAAVARAQADFLLLDGRLQGLVRAFQTGRFSRRIVLQNLWWAAAYNVICIPLALAGLMPPWAAGLGMAVSSLAVVLNALRASRQHADLARR